MADLFKLLEAKTWADLERRRLDDERDLAARIGSEPLTNDFRKRGEPIPNSRFRLKTILWSEVIRG